MNDNKVKVHIMPKLQFKDTLDRNDINDSTVEEFTKIAFISINDSSGSFYKDPLFKSDHTNVLSLWFDDVEQDGQISPTNKEMTRAFTKEDASKIITFLKINERVETVLVHCAAGISRSGAVGTFVLDYYKGDQEFFKLTNRHISPNGRVMRMLNETLRNG